MAKRKSTRVEMNRPIEVQGARGASQGIVRDFSPGGCRIQQENAKVNCGMRLTLRISLPDRIDPIAAASRKYSDFVRSAEPVLQRDLTDR